MMWTRSFLLLMAAWPLFFCAPGIAHGAGVDKKAHEAVAHAGNVDKLTDLIVMLMPLGKIFESIAVENPAWPFQDQPERATKSQLSCLRSELSAEGFRRLKRKEVEVYAASHPDTIESDILLLESGVAELFGRLVMAGADSERTGVPVDSDAILKSASTAQVDAFTLFFSEPKLAELRKLGGVGNMLSSEKTKDENEAAGEQLGQDMASKFISTSMKTCEVN